MSERLLTYDIENTRWMYEDETLILWVPNSTFQIYLQRYLQQHGDLCRHQAENIIRHVRFWDRQESMHIHRTNKSTGDSNGQ